MHPTDKAARVAGAWYLTLVLTGPFSLIYVPSKLIVRGDATATANNILAHETLFRLGIIADLFGSVIFICLGIALYRLLSGVNKTHASLMVAFVLVSAAVGFFNGLNNIAALTVFRGENFLAAFDKPQLNALAYLFVRLHSQGNLVNEIFWGLWLFPFGLLVFRSGFLPRLLGVWLMLNCFAWVTLSITAQFFPGYYDAAFRVAQPVLFGELAIMLWLLIKGAKVRSPQADSISPSGTRATAQRGDIAHLNDEWPNDEWPNDELNKTDRGIEPAQQTAAKVAGFSCLFATAIVVFANYGLLNPLIVRGNASETARNIVGHETQLRLTATCFLIYSASVVVLLVALYVILKPVNRGIALVGAFFRLIFALLWLLTTINLLGALRLLGSTGYLQVFETDRLQALARLLIAANFDDYYVGLPFFALASTVCSYLWLKSNYNIPRALAGFGLISSAWCVLCAFVYLVFPGFAKAVDPYWFDSPMGIFEIALSFWLLIKGLRPSAVDLATR